MAKFLVLFSIIAGALAVPAPHQQMRVDPNLNWRVVGGSDAEEGAFPYQISLRGFGGGHTCGGSIIDSTTILTAAHCVAGLAYLGSNQLNSGGTKYQVSSVRAHQGFNGLTINNDVAILKLSSPITFSDKVSPIELESLDVGGGVDAVLSGWGTTSFPGPTPNNLQSIKLKTISVAECQSFHTSVVTPVRDSQVCTLTQKGEGACHGDSGGPLVANGRQIGIVSWGRPCAVGYPDVFTRVSSYIDWIKKNSD